MTMKSTSRRALTTRKIATTKPPKDTPLELPDGVVGGLCLRITPNGVKGFILSTRIDGKLRRKSLGRFPVLTLAQARIEASKLKDGTAAWGNSTDDGHLKSHGEVTFGDVAREYVNRECSKLARGWEVERIIARELLPKWRDRPMAELRRRDAVLRFDALVDAGKPAAAIRLHEIARRMGRWAVRRDLVDTSPFSDIDAPADKVMRDRVLTPDEIREVWKAAGIEGYPFGSAYRMLLLTGQRKSEVGEMMWPEINLDNKTWTIPATRTKNKKPMIVPLSDMTLALIEGLPEFTQGDFVFTTMRGARPISGWTKAKNRMDDLSGVSGWINHDLRRTLRTGLSELGVPRIVAERVLNHAERDRLADIYDRYGYAAEKRDALDRWASRVREIVTPPPENVVKLPRGKRRA